MTVLPSGGNDTPALLAAGHTGEDIGPGNFLLLSPLANLPSGWKLQGRGKRITNFWVQGQVFSHQGPAACLGLEDISFLASVANASMGHIWGQVNPSNPADVSGYTSVLDISSCEFIGLGGVLDIRYCMGGLRVTDNDWNQCVNGLYTFDCGEQKIRGNRFNNIGGWGIKAQGPSQGWSGTDHSAEDSAFTDNSINGAGESGIWLIDLGFFTLTGNDSTACGVNGLRMSGTCSDGSVVGNVFGSLHATNHAICMDTSLPQLRGPHHNISFGFNHGDGSYCGAVLAGDKLTYTHNRHTANSNVDILALGCTNSDVCYNSCDSTEFSGGSALNSIFEAGGSNNRINSNWLRRPIAQGGSGSEYVGNRTIV